MGHTIPWQPAEDKALKDFVKEHTGDELAPVGPWDSAWADLAKRWKALGKVKGFQTDRNARAMYERHYRLRRKAGRVDSLSNAGKRAWSEEEEKALLDFVKERKGDEMAAQCGDAFFKDLEKAWQSEGFDTARTAEAMSSHHKRVRKKRAEQPATAPQPNTTSSTTSATAQAPSLRRSGGKRTASAAVLATSPPSANAKKPRSSPSPSASTALSPPLPVAMTVSVFDIDSDSDTGSQLDWLTGIFPAQAH